MLDPYIRPLIDPPLKIAARFIAPHISADAMTIIGFACGLACFFAIAAGANVLALSFLLVSRLADGLDGAIARQGAGNGTHWGGYADIVADFLIWALLPLGFVFYDTSNSVAAAVLLSAFAMSMTVFLAFAIVAEKRGLETQAQGRKSFFYMAGLAEGTETIAFFAFVCLVPSAFAFAAYVFAVVVFVSVIGRVGNAFIAIKAK